MKNKGNSMKFEQILELVDAVSKSTLTEFKYEEEGVKLSLKKTVDNKVTVSTPVYAQQQNNEAAVQTAEPSKADTAEGNVVKSPLVGTFYTAPSEDADAFVSVGDTVKEGQTLAIVEAMKLMNDIESDYSGVVAEILVENGEAVEYGQPLFIIK